VRYRHVLLVTELGADPGAALAAVRALAPEAESLVVVAGPRARPHAWPWRDAPGPDPSARLWLERVRDAAARAAPRAEVGLAPDLGADSLEEAAAASGAELVVAGPDPVAAIPALSELRRRRPVAVLWVPARGAPPRDRPPAELLCVALGDRAEAAIAAFLRDHGHPGVHATVFSLAGTSPGELAASLVATGVRASVELLGSLGVPPWRALDALQAVARERGVDLVVLPRFPGFLLRSAAGPAPILVLPPPPATGPALRRPLDVPDLVDDGGPIRVRLGQAYGVGRNPPIPDQEVAFVSAGRLAAVVASRGGEAELPPGLAAASLGVFRVGDGAAADPVLAIERLVAVVRPGRRPLVVFDADLPEEDLSSLAFSSGAELLAVRLRPLRSCHLVRERLRTAGLAPRVVDASAILDEGAAEDVSDDFDALRLARVAARLRGAGFPVAGIVHGGPVAPEAQGFAVLRPVEVPLRRWAPPPPPAPRPVSLEARLAGATGTAPIAGNRVEVELDNGRARRWLLEAIEGASRRVHLQAYIVSDDDAGRRIEAALRAAGRRGVAVRLLVDSLHSRHGSFGMQNPLLARLSACAGVEVRAARPLAGVPSLLDLKARDHRKLLVADGSVALLGGRNLAHEYYVGFDEVALAADAPWRTLPWLDGGARVRGPAVAAVDRSFREAWVAAGGAGFEIDEPPHAGPTPARVVIHRGLRDAAGLEAYLALVETARSHVVVVTGFPLLLELQHALVRALRRGVRVRALFGAVTPTHGGEPFGGGWTSARTAATWLVHSRMDALVAAGAEAYQLALRDVRGWAPGLGLVHPHVHAKALAADGRVCAVGSANLDVTSSYWEDELLLLVEDADLARGFEARVDALAAGSVRVDRDDPAWQRLARRREWMRKWPGVLSV
jgi:phosphatidylserine/phosphatidylglycerophosphate/cardiolipin synthase-like enzyme